MSPVLGVSWSPGTRGDETPALRRRRHGTEDSRVSQPLRPGHAPARMPTAVDVVRSHTRRPGTNRHCRQERRVVGSPAISHGLDDTLTTKLN